MKTAGNAYLFWLLCLVGFCGIHRFYSGNIVTGFIWLFTGGLCGIGQIVDLFLIPGLVAAENKRTLALVREATR